MTNDHKNDPETTSERASWIDVANASEKLMLEAAADLRFLAHIFTFVLPQSPAISCLNELAERLVKQARGLANAVSNKVDVDFRLSMQSSKNLFNAAVAGVAMSGDEEAQRKALETMIGMSSNTGDTSPERTT